MIVAPLIDSDGNCSKRTARAGSGEASSRPFSVAPMKRGPRPRATTWLALPRSMPDDMPGKRDKDSAMVVSGSLPISSDVMTSMMLFDASFAATALRTDARMPVTVTCSILSADAG